MKFIRFALLLVLFTGCASRETAAMVRRNEMSPMQAVFLAATIAPDLVAGHFRLRVQASGKQDGYVYLNSERDYRDQRNLTIAIHPDAVAVFAERLGQSPMEYFKGRDLVVKGAAGRVTIYFTDSVGVPTDKYYYQTHVVVTSFDQIKAVE